MNGITNKTLSIMMVIGLVVGGLPLFFAATDNAEAAVGVWEKRDKALSITDSKGYLTVDVSTFEDEGNKPIQGYTMLLKWDNCRKDLNPFSFWRTIREPDHASITTDAKGEASFTFSIPNGCWTENLWVYGSSDGWQNVEYFLGNIASTNIHLNIQTQASMATQHAIQRANTLGLIQDWYEMVPYEHETTHTSPVQVYGSKTYAGTTKLAVISLGNLAGAGVASPVSTASNGTIIDRVIHSPVDRINANEDQWTEAIVKSVFGEQASYSGSNAELKVYSNNPQAPNTWTITDAKINGPMMVLSYATDSNLPNLRLQVVINGEIVVPTTGGWYSTPSDAAGQINIPVPYTYGKDSLMDIQIRAYMTANQMPIYGSLIVPSQQEFYLANIGSATSTTLNAIKGHSIVVDLSGHVGTWQVGGRSTTLTDQDLVPVNAQISSIYPLVISNPRFDKTPIAGAGNGLKFDVYNIKGQPSNETIYLSLIADGSTTVWSTTVGQREYPAWTNSSQFTTVHLTDITFPAEARREYNLRITSGGAITEIPVVFYPPELDSDVIYEPKKDLDDIIKDYGTVNAAALKAYHDWAASMQPKIEAIQSDVESYTKLFEQRLAVDNLALADAAATRGLELIDRLKGVCKGDGSDTSIGELTSYGQGIWSSYMSALLYRETAIAYEAGQPAFGNSTAMDAWYQDLVSKRIKTGLDEPGGYDDPNSVAVWVGLVAALVVGGLVMYLSWKYIVPPLKQALPKGRSKRSKTIRTITPVVITIVIAVAIAVLAFLATSNIVLSIEAALR